MIRHRTGTWAVLAVGLGFVTPPPGRAQDAVPARSAEDTAALARAATLDQQWGELYGKGKFPDAVPLAREALAIRERVLGPDHVDVAASLNFLGVLLAHQAVHVEARQLYERALAIREKALGADHLDVAATLNNIASLLHDQGALAAARPLYERALAIKTHRLGEDHPSVALGLNNLAMFHFDLAAYSEARPLLERALAIRERTLAKDAPEIAQSLNNLGSILEAQGAYAEARSHYVRALEIWEATLGKEHPEVATGLSNLAILLTTQGDFAEARSLHARSLEISERALGRDHPSVANHLNSLAELLRMQGAFAEARPLYDRALAILEKRVGAAHPMVALVRCNVALSLRAQGEYKAARELYASALTIRETSLGRDHPSVATTLNNIAELLRAERSDADVRGLYDRAIAIQERALGRDHPSLAVSLDNLAQYRRDRGDFPEAMALHERALAILESSLGRDHPSVANCLNNMGQLLEAQHAYDAARSHYERSLVATAAHVRAQLAALGPAQRLALVRTVRHRLGNWLRFAPAVGLSGYAELLRFRGLVARAETAERILSRHAVADDRRVLQSLQAATHRAARLANRIPSSLQAEVRAGWQAAYAGAAAERERILRELAGRIEPFRAARERLDLSVADVQARLGPDTALVDFLRVGQRYLAWVVRGTGAVLRVDVGAADAIDEACGDFVAAVRDAGDVAATGATLRTLVWTPIEGRIGDGVGRIVICPDAALAAIPFGALPGREGGQSLLDDYALSHVMQAQDLVARKDATPKGSGAVVIGGVDYARADGGPTGPTGTTSSARPDGPPVVDGAPLGSAFVPLPQTRLEAEALGDRLERDSTTLLIGAEATEGRLREAAKGKRFVHVATHGFAREDLLAGLYTRRIEEAFTSADMERQLAVGHDPMLLSGLALAGANPREGANGDDGILTALEASYLDLDGVDLVTLSACETAKGTAESGEGVQGLVSAFQMAGARRVIASLWKVDDEATRRLMEGVYERILRKEDPLSPADALRASARALRAHKDDAGRARFAAPRYWAAFVAYGG